MKTTFAFLFAILLCSVNFIAQSKPPVTAHVSAVSDDERDVSNFTGIVAGGPINVVVKFGNKESLKFEGDADAIATLTSEVKGNILVIRPKTSWKSWAKKYENVKIVAYVTAKQISSLVMSGDGSINVTGLVHAEKLAVTLSGSGNIKTTVDVESLTGVISGSGNLTVNGKAAKSSVTISGSGNFEGKELAVSDLSARISGSGNVNIKADHHIKAVLVGSGEVNYRGNATVEKTIVGSGGVNKI